MSEGLLYTIKQVCDLIGLPPSTLRFWEKELEGFLVPIRTSGRQRRYDQNALILIQHIKDLRGKGIAIAEIKELFLNGSEPGEPSPKVEIELLANRVAEAVKAEIFRFFMEKGK